MPRPRRQPCRERRHARVRTAGAFPSPRARLGKERNGGGAGSAMPGWRGVSACGISTRRLASAAGTAAAELSVGDPGGGVCVQSPPRRLSPPSMGDNMGTDTGSNGDRRGDNGRSNGDSAGRNAGSSGDDAGSDGDKVGDKARRNGDNGGDNAGSTGDNAEGRLGVPPAQATWEPTLQPYPPPRLSPVNGKRRQDPANALPINVSFSVGVSKQKGEKSRSVFGE